MAVTGGPGGLTRGGRFSILVNVVLICVLGTLLAFAVIWLVGRLAWNHDLRADLTRDARFTMDPLAASVLRGLTEPVHATFVYGIDDEIRRRALDLAKQPREDILQRHFQPVLYRAASRVQVVLREWSKMSEKLTVDIIDADHEPQRMAEAAQRQGKTAGDLARGINQVVFEMPPSRKRSVPMGRMFTIDWGFFSPYPGGVSKFPEMSGAWRVQSELTETLRAMASGESLKLGLPQGIAPALAPDSPGFESLREFLGSQGFDPFPFDLAQGVPPAVSVVAFLGMGRRLLPIEASALSAYERTGGRILVLADPRKPEAFPGLLDEFGVKLEPGVVEDEQRKAPGQADRTVLLSDELCTGDHEIDRPLARRIGLAIGPARPIRIENLGSAGAERVALLRASSGALMVPIEYREQSGEPDILTSARKSAPNAVLGAALKRPGMSGRESRIVVYGSWEVADPWHVQLGTHFGNRDLLLNSLNWLADRHAAIGIVEREVQANRVELTPGFLASFRWVTWGALNLVLALIATAVWFARRN
jgi:hypothetical protein